MIGAVSWAAMVLVGEAVLDLAKRRGRGFLLSAGAIIGLGGIALSFIAPISAVGRVCRQPGGLCSFMPGPGYEWIAGYYADGYWVRDAGPLWVCASPSSASATKAASTIATSTATGLGP